MDFDTTRTNRTFTTTTTTTKTTNSEFFSLDEDVGEICALLDNSAAKHRISCRPMKPKRGAHSASAELAKAKQEKDAIIRELIETEEEFVRDLKYLITNYVKWAEDGGGGSPDGKVLAKHSHFLFGGLQDIFEFHKTVLLEGMKYYSDQANQIGRSFTRLERDFDKHANYIDRMESINEFLCDNPLVNDAFDNRSSELDDTGRSLIDYVRLPAQRLNDYTVLLSELIKISKQLGDQTTDLDKGLELVTWIPTKARDLKFIHSIEGFGDTRAGRILRHLSEFELVQVENTPPEGDVKEQGNFGLKDKDQNFYIFATEPQVSLGWVIDIRPFTKSPEPKSSGEEEPEPAAKKGKLQDRLEETQVSATTTPPVTASVNGVEITDVTSVHEDRSVSVDRNVTRTRRVIDIPIQIESSADDSSISERIVKTTQHQTSIQEIEVDTSQSSSSRVPVRTEEIQIQKTVVTTTTTTNVIEEEEEEEQQQSEQQTFSRLLVKEPASSQRNVQIEVQVERFQTSLDDSGTLAGHQEELETEQWTSQQQEASLSKLPDTSELIVHDTKTITSTSNYSETRSNARDTSYESSEGPFTETTSESTQFCEIGPSAESFSREQSRSVNIDGAESFFERTVSVREEKQEQQQQQSSQQGQYLRLEQEERLRQETEVKLVEEEEIERRRKDQEAERVRLEEEQQERRAQEQERQKQETERKLREEEQERKEEAERKRVEAERKAEQEREEQEAERKRLQEEEQERLRQEEERKRLQEERLKKDEEKKRLAEEERKAEEQRQKQEEQERLRKEEEERKRIEEEERVRREEEKKRLEEEQRKAEEQRQKEEQERLRKEEERKRLEEEEREKEAAERKRLEEEELKAEKERQRQEAERKRLEEEERQRLKAEREAEEERQRQEAEAERKRLEAKKRQLEEEERQRQEAEKQRVEQERQAAEEERQRQEAEKERLEQEREVQEALAKKRQEEEGALKFAEECKRAETTKRRRLEEQESTKSQDSVKKPYSRSNSNLIRMDSNGSNGAGRPSFTLNVKSIEVEPGDNATLVVETASETPSIVTWLKDNKPLDDKLADRVKIISKDNAHTLTLLNCRDEDSGLYTAKCSNVAGATCSSGFINVHELTPEERQQKALERQPNFIVKMKDTDLLLDTTVCFIVRASGDPEPTLKFFKNDSPLQESDRVFVIKNGDLTELTIRNVTDEDGGVYSCVATNKYGENSTAATLNITDEKSVFPGLGSKLLQPGEEPEFNWYRDGVQFAPEDKFKVLFRDDEDTLALVFQHVRPEDAGLYTCVASTTSGKISCSAELTVQGAIHQLLREPEAPQITAELTDTEVSTGGSAMLELKIAGFPKPEVAWTKDDKEFKAGGKYRFLYEDEESIALIIKGVDVNDAGKYEVIAKNDLGEARTCGILKVNSPPKFQTKMQDCACMTEETFSMSVTVSGSPEPQIKWYKDGQLIIESERIHMTKEANGVFTITFEKIRLEDSGAYSVVASNAIGQMSEFWNMIANSKARITKKIDSVIEIKEKETIELTVEVDGNPEPEIKWFVDTKEVGKGKSYKYTSSSRTDQKITVKCANTFGTDECSGQVKVLRGSKISTKLQDTKVQYNSDAEFTVKVDEYPKGKVLWYIDGVQIDGKKYETIDDGDNHTLKIKGATASSTVKVRAENQYGYDEQEARLDIIRKPEIKKPLEESYTEVEQKTLKLSIDVSGNPEPAVHWFHNGQQVEADTRIKITREGTETWNLTFNVLLPSDAGDWSVKCVNEAGEAESRTVIIVEGKPEFVKKLVETVECMESDSVTFEVKVTGSPTPVIQWLLNNEELTVTKRTSIETTTTKSTTTSKLVIKNTTLDDSGTVTCVARNEHGSSETTSKLIVQKSGPKLKLDASLRIVEAGQELKLTATASDGAKIDWAVAGTKEKAKGGEFKLKPEKDCVITVLADDGKSCDKVEIPVRVMSRPKITGLTDITCGPGDSITFSPKVESEPDGLQAAWYRGEEKIKDCPPNDYSLQVSNASPAEAGKYTLKVSNLVGESSQSAKLNVMVEPPSFTRGLTDAKLREGENLTLRVRVIGLPEPKVVWEHDGKVIPVDGHEGTYEIIADAVKLHQFGTYTVTAENCAGKATTAGKVTLIEEKPLITKGPEKAKTVDESEPFSLSATVTGSPLPAVQWFKDGEPVVPEAGKVELSSNPAGLQKLTVAKADKGDAGIYTLEAKNPIASAKSNPSTVTVVAAPVLPSVKIVAPEQAEQGALITLQIRFDGEPAPKLQLFENDKLIEPVRIAKDDSGKPVNYVVQAPAKDATVLYSAVATNPLGKGSDQVEIALKAPPAPPKILEALPSEKTAVEGTPLKLTAVLIGSPLPEIQWLKDGKPIPSETKEVDGKLQTCVLVDGVGKPDAGVYQLVATNPSGTQKQECKVSVLGKTDDSKPLSPPDFTTGLPADLVVSEGEDLVLRVEVSGNPLPEVQWGRLSGKPEDDGASKGDQGSGAVPSPTAADTSDAGAAKPNSAGPAQGEQGAGAIPSPRGAADASDAGSAKPEVADGSGNQEGGSPATADVSDGAKPTSAGVAPSDAGSGNQDATGQTKKEKIASQPSAVSPAQKADAKPAQKLESLESSLGPGVKVEQSFDGKNAILRIPGIRRGHEGPITVQLTNSQGSKSSTCNVGVRKVYSPAKIVDKFNDVHQVRGSDARFTAKVTGEPRPDVEWFFNGKPLPTDVKKYFTKWDGKTASLTVYNVDEKDLGKYKLVAKNLEGSDECEGDLVELKGGAKAPVAEKGEKPYFLKKTADAEIYEGMTVKFTACVGGTPEPDFHWFKDDARIYPGSRYTMENNGNGLLRLLITKTGPADLGVYTLKIFNKYGEDKCSSSCTMEDFQVGSGNAGDGKGVKRDVGPPNPLPDAPIISSMTDRHLTLSWKPALRTHIDYPVTYTVEMCNIKDGKWFTLRSGIKGCSTEVRNLEPGQDYKFRVRVENRLGISEPSPYAQTLRYKFQWKPTPWAPPGGDYDLTRPPHDGFTHAPKFLNKNTEQYGAPGVGIGVEWWLYGYPKPTVTFFFNGEELSSTDHVFDSNGRVILYIDRLSESRCGWYECVGVNEHGEDRYKIHVLQGEHPKWIIRLQETHILERRDGKLSGVVTGKPQPEFKWFKDWSTLGESSRIKFNVLETEPGTYRVSCTLTDAILKDHGLYSCTASNVVGTASSSANIAIDEAEEEWRFRSYNKRLSPLGLRNKNIREYYNFGDELGRGTQGITRHGTSIQSGIAVAIKSMQSSDANKREWMRHEFDIHSELFHPGITRIYDGYIDERSVYIVSDICTGGDIIGSCISRGGFSEMQVSDYMRQLLLSLDYMHNTKSIAHLGINAFDLMFSHEESDTLKLVDFGLARRITSKLERLDYGHPEFASPEALNGEGVGYSSDMWSVGILTYLLLNGTTPFLRENDQMTIESVKRGEWEILNKGLSEYAQDFLRNLISFDSRSRLDVRRALEHPWISRYWSNSDKKITSSLTTYRSSLTRWYENASCKTIYRRNPWSYAYSHQSRMIYPPGVDDYEIEHGSRDPKSFGCGVPNYPRPDLNVEVGCIKSESYYQQGPDTYLLQLRDTDFPARLRQYMKVAASRSPTLALQLRGQAYDRNIPIIRERRRFQDVMDEEVKDECTQGKEWRGEPRRLRHEVGMHLDTTAQADAIVALHKDGQPAFIREGPEAVIRAGVGDKVVIPCVATGSPDPTVQWFKNDIVIGESRRVHPTNSSLTIDVFEDFDFGVYKLSARNTAGSHSIKFRIVHGHFTEHQSSGVDYSVEVERKVDSSGAEGFTELLRDGVFGLWTIGSVNGGKLAQRLSTPVQDMELRSSLAHTGFLRLSSIINESNYLYFVYQESSSEGYTRLVDKFIKEGVYSELDITNALQQILPALGYVQWRGLQLLNLNFDNILVDSQGNVRLFDTSSIARVAKIGTVLPIPNQITQYTAPEVLFGEQVHPTTDVWSVGCIVYSLLSGCWPFAGDDDKMTKSNIQFVRYRFEPLYENSTPEATRFLMMIFKKCPLRRPTIEELLDNRWLSTQESLIRKRAGAAFKVSGLEKLVTSSTFVISS